MAIASRSRRSDNTWPGFVDALTSLLLVIIFLLSVFMLTHFFLSQALSGREEALERLNQQVAELGDLLSLERQANTDLRLNVAQLSSSLQDANKARDELVLKLDESTSQLDDTRARLAAAEQATEVDRETIKAQLADIERLKRDIGALREVRQGLETKVAELAGQLEGSRRDLSQLRDKSQELAAELASEQERTVLAQKTVADREIRLSELQALLIARESEIEDERDLSRSARRQVALLSSQISALRAQLSRLEAALQASEAKDREQQSQITNLGQRLNAALARKVEELSRYRSEFFGKLREVLGERRDIHIVGDRFVFQSEVLFESGSAELGLEGQTQLGQLARTLLEITPKIPDEVNWVLRVDGHTDRIPIATPRFPSNWELSTGRATSVVKHLIAAGIPPNRLAATGFGEFQPLDDRDDEIAHRRNRRIEFKLTER
ncbi:MAG: peptidoglycan -binding protein [Alphaproteobacteria bacterium]|nr:peptidoglycan -binding protein [Alphaproteobacteria bacterium]